MIVNVVSESAFTVQGHGVHTAFEETVAALKKYTDYEVMVNSDMPADVVHIHTVGPFSLWKLLRAKRAKVISAHVTPDSFIGSLIGAKYWYVAAKWYLRWFYNMADGVLAVSADVADELKRMGVKRPIFIVHNVIDTTVFANNAEEKAKARAKLDIKPDAFVVVGNGQVQPRKRVDCFVAAAKALPEVSFIWVGGMPFKGVAAESAAMERMMHEHPENLRFSGLIPRSEVVDYFRAADLFFLPSEQETFGIVVVEAAAAGLPVLLRDVEQYRETFGDGYERGSDDLFIALIERFSKDKEFYHKWKVAAHGIARRYGAESGAKRLAEVYEDVLSNVD